MVKHLMRFLSAQFKDRTVTYVIPIIYILCVSIYMIYHLTWFSPDQFFAFAIIGVFFLGRTKEFLQDWLPMIVLLLGYEYLRGIIPHLVLRAHVFPLIQLETYIFGFIPTIWMQNSFFTQHSLSWYDYFSVLLYISHFVVPLIVAFIFWLHSRSQFKTYISALVLLSYLTFFTYIIFPAVPPWMASEQGHLPNVYKILDIVFRSYPYSISIFSIYNFFGANLVAAFPSLHAAFPLMVFLFVRKISPLIFLGSLLYVFGVWVSVVYLGEHYVVDVFGGGLYAIVSYFLVKTYNKVENHEKGKNRHIPAF